MLFILFRQKATLQPTDYLTFNLAVSDASISVFGYSRGIIEIFNVFQDSGYLISSIWTCQVRSLLTWPRSSSYLPLLYLYPLSPLCDLSSPVLQVDGFFTLVFGLSSINTLTVISITRYIKGCHPSRGEASFSLTHQVG